MDSSFLNRIGKRVGGFLGRGGWHLRWVLLVALAGCASPESQAYHFPATWPGSAPLAEAAPTVSVQPLTMTMVGHVDAAPQLGLPTSAVLSALLVKHLHVNGVNAILEEPQIQTAQYALDCMVPQLGVAIHKGYPQKRLYQATLACTLREASTDTVVWKRRLTQDYELTILVDLLTKIEPRPHAHDRVLFRECIVPLWDRMAMNVGTVVVSQQRLSASNRGAAP